MSYGTGEAYYLHTYFHSASSPRQRPSKRAHWADTATESRERHDTEEGRPSLVVTGAQRWARQCAQSSAPFMSPSGHTFVTKKGERGKRRTSWKSSTLPARQAVGSLSRQFRCEKRSPGVAVAREFGYGQTRIGRARNKKTTTPSGKWSSVVRVMLGEVRNREDRALGARQGTPPPEVDRTSSPLLTSKGARERGQGDEKGGRRES